MDVDNDEDQPMDDVEDHGDTTSADANASAPSAPLPASGSSSVHSMSVNEEPVVVTPFQSRIPEIWEAFFQRMERIDQLEKRIEEHVSRKRRRIQNLLEQIPSHRRSTVRMFVTHQFDKYSGIWTLVIEGKLLIGNLDHASAATVDKEGVMSVRGDRQHEKAQSRDGTTLTGSAASATAAAAASLTPDRNQYRIGAEEEDPVVPITFTHLFDKVEVTFRTIYQPRTAATTSHAAPGGLSPVKKSRSAKRKTVQPEPVAEVVPADLRASSPTKLVWNKGPTATAAASSSASPSATTTTDAHAFWFQYNNHFSERPPPPNMKFHGIAAEIKLYRTRAPALPQYDQDVNAEPLYQIANESFRDKIFGGKYGTEQPKTDDKESDEKEEPSSPPSAPPVVPGCTGSLDYTIPSDNDIQIPLFLSYNEIIMALFQYIQDNDLHDPSDKSLIVCDKLLTEALGVESINFGCIRQILFEKGIIKPVARTKLSQHPSMLLGTGQRHGPLDPVAPVCLTYLMNEKSTSAQVPTGFQEEQVTPSVTATGRRPMAGLGAEVADDPYHSPTVLSFDMDVTIPALFNSRTRDLLLNVKKREFEYTTCRTKARYLLVASKGSEEPIKNKIEQSISGQGFIPENVPVFLALARAAHPHSEARSAAQIDARTSDLVGRVEETNRKAMAAWEAVDAMRRGMGVEETALDDDESDSEEDDTIQ